MSIIRQDYGVLGTDTQTQQLIAPVLTKMKADRAFSKGDQFIVDSVLYKITADTVASGADLVVGTNCAVSDTITQQIKLKSVASYNVTTGNTYRGAANLVAQQLNSDEVIKHWNTLKLRVGNYIANCIEATSNAIVFSINIIGTYNLLYFIRMRFDGTNSAAYTSTDGGSPTEISTSNVTSLLTGRWEVFY